MGIISKSKTMAGGKRKRTVTSYYGTTKKQKSGRASTTRKISSGTVAAVGFNAVLRPKQRGTLMYCEPHNQLTTLNPSLTYRINSCYDPNYGTADIHQHQPRGFDQLATMYDRYFVRNCDIRVVFCPDNATGTNTAVKLYMTISNTLSLPNSELNFAEDPNAQMKAGSAQYFHSTNSTGAGGTGPLMLRRTVNIQRFSKGERNQLSAPSNVNPNNGVYLHIRAYNASGSSVTGRVHVTLLMDTEFYEPKKPEMS